MEQEIFSAPFGPIESPFIRDDFSLEDVGSECIGTACKNLGDELNTNKLVQQDPAVNYMTICMPCYNEEVEEFYKTILSCKCITMHPGRQSLCYLT